MNQYTKVFASILPMKKYFMKDIIFAFIIHFPLSQAVSLVDRRIEEYRKTISCLNTLNKAEYVYITRSYDSTMWSNTTKLHRGGTKLIVYGKKLMHRSKL